MSNGYVLQCTCPECLVEVDGPVDELDTLQRVIDERDTAQATIAELTARLATAEQERDEWRDLANAENMKRKFVEVTLARVRKWVNALPQHISGPQRVYRELSAVLDGEEKP